MLKKLFTPKKEDICPNCGTACFATDVLCPNCGGNLDELFQQLPVEIPKSKSIITIPRKYELLIKWVFATSIGFALGEVFLSPIAFLFVPFSSPKNWVDVFGIMLKVAAGIATGVSVGIIQWLLLRYYITNSWRWVIATVIGMASGGFLEAFLYSIARRYLPMDATLNTWKVTTWIAIFVYGIVIGLVQWVVLRKVSSKTWTWVVANGFGWALAITIGDELLRPMFYPCCADYWLNPIDEIIIYGVSGILIGIITGILLSWLLKQRNLMVQNAA